MNLKQVILKSKWQAVREAFLLLYPNQKRSISGYENVYKKLRSKPVLKSSMTLYCDTIEPQFKDDEVSYDIYGVNGTKNKDGELEKYSLSLFKWSEWLGVALSDQILKNYTKEQIISLCLFEMTFHGFLESDVRKFKNELGRRIKDHDDPIKYIIVSRILPKSKWQCYFNVSDETWCSDIDSATVFKREKYALAVLKALGRKNDKTNIIAKITTKNNKRRIVKYLTKSCF